MPRASSRFVQHDACALRCCVPRCVTPHAACAGTQLIRRNDELALLYEKIKIQQSALSKGQVQYRDRLNEVRVLKIRLNDLKRELHILKSSVANIDVLKREVHGLGKQLLQERTKVKALSEELENPLNVHRCAPDHFASAVFSLHCH